MLRYVGKKVGYRIENKLFSVDFSYGILSKEIKCVGIFDLFVMNDRLVVSEHDNVEDISNDIPKILACLYVDSILSNNDYRVLSSDDILYYLDYYNIINDRYFVSDLVDKLLSKSPINILILLGVRRTGKTIAMYSAIRGLINAKVSKSKIIYLSINKSNEIHSDDMITVINSLQKVGYQYIFIDEVTYIKDEDGLMFMSGFSDGMFGTKLVLSGTNSAVFLEPLRTFMYDRVYAFYTSYISYKEYCSLYDTDILGYIHNGGLLVNSRRSDANILDVAKGSVLDDHIQGILDYVYDYIDTSIIDNIEAYISTCDFSKCRYLEKIYYDNREIFKSVILKWLNIYSTNHTYVYFNRLFKLYEGGSLKTMVGLSGMSGVRVLCKRLISMYNDKNGVTMLPRGIDYDRVCHDMIGMFYRVGCYYKYDNFEYILPFIIRYGLSYNLISMLHENYSELVDGLNLPLSYEEISDFIMKAINGMMLEEVSRLNLLKSGKAVFKYSDGINEVDIVTSDELIEVKLSNKFNKYMCRHLVSKSVCDRYPKYKKRIVLYTGTDNFGINVSERDCIGIRISDIESKGIEVSGKLTEEYARSNIDSYRVSVMNIGDYLKLL